MVSTNRKNLQIKECCFNWTENRFPLAGMKNLFKKYVSTRQKIAYIGRDIQKIEENRCQWQ